MLTLSYPHDSFFVGRIKNFLHFKGIPFKDAPFQNPNRKGGDEISGNFFSGEGETTLRFPDSTEKMGNSLSLLRDIEEFSPFPIGFIGPIESTFQWSSMILTSYPEISAEILESIFEEISEKVEDEYFLMGPTFSVADCVLASDLQKLSEKFLLPDLLTGYIDRVQKTCTHAN